MKKALIVSICAFMALSFASCGNANETANVMEVDGKFYESHTATDVNGNVDIYYSFRSNDGSLWWDLTEHQMGFVPNGNKEYVFVYDNMGTTSENKSCDCAPEDDCECEVYDDVFVGLRAKH